MLLIAHAPAAHILRRTILLQLGQFEQGKFILDLANSNAV